MYVKIVDRGECFSTTMEYINGVYANKNEWQKHNFYPQNGMVGKVVKITPRAYIIKIMEGIYVPMTKEGIKEISFEEYQAGLKNNICSGMDDRQKRINEGTDSIIGTSWTHLPDLREYFKPDIRENIRKLTCDYTKNIYLPDLEKSCVMYSGDMILEYKRKWGSTLPPYVIIEISNQVFDVYKKFFPSDFREESTYRCLEQIKSLIEKEDAQDIINDYYEKVDIRYGWG